MLHDDIKVFLTLSDTLSFQRTAKELGLAQSTISHRINKLENHIGASLFARSKAGTNLTTAGLRFLPHARNIWHTWHLALHDSNVLAHSMTLKIALQHDLADWHIGNWLKDFRQIIPETNLYVEADYSDQMCQDVVSGKIDFALIYTPKVHPDLYSQMVGLVSYFMVSTHQDELSNISTHQYIKGNYSPAFAQKHTELHPNLINATLSSGQTNTVMSMLTHLGGATYLLYDAAEQLKLEGKARLVKNAPIIEQPVYAAIHMRYRTRSLHQRLMQVVRNHFLYR